MRVSTLLLFLVFNLGGWTLWAQNRDTGYFIQEDLPVQPRTVSELPAISPNKEKRYQEESQTDAEMAQMIEKTRLENERKLREDFKRRLKSSSSPLPSSPLPKSSPHEFQSINPPVEIQSLQVNMQTNNTNNNEEEEEEDVEKTAIHSRARVSSFLQSFKGYVSASLNSVSYLGTTNVQSKRGIGFLVGTDISEHLSLEIIFAYSKHLIDESYWKQGFDIFNEVSQYNFGGVMKYRLLNNFFINPYVGAVVSVTQREYSELGIKEGNGRKKVHFNGDTSSTVLDAGLAAGFEIILRNNFGLGFDFKHMRDVYQNQSFNFGQMTTNIDGTPIEEISYNMLSFYGSLFFH